MDLFRLFCSTLHSASAAGFSCTSYHPKLMVIRIVIAFMRPTSYGRDNPAPWGHVGDLDELIDLPDTRIYEIVGKDPVAIYLMGRIDVQVSIRDYEQLVQRRGFCCSRSYRNWYKDEYFIECECINPQVPES